MCFSAEASFSAWVICIAISIYLLHRDQNYDKWNAMFIITFSTIQLLEGLMWLNMGNANTNSLLTKIILIALLLQPLVQTFYGYQATQQIFLKIMIYIHIAILVYGLFLVFNPIAKFHTTKGPGGHLVWHRSNQTSHFIPLVIIYLVGLFTPLFFMKNYRGVPLIIIGVGTFLYSRFYATPQEFSSMWCFTAVLYAIVALLV